MKCLNKKIISLSICVILIILISVPIFATSNEYNKIHSNNITILDIKMKYNPLRKDVENIDGLHEIEKLDFNDENVQIERVTYYDEFGNKTEEYINENALIHLYKTEKQNPSLITTKDISHMINKTTILNDSNRFESRVIESFVDSKAKSKVIRSSPMDINDFNVSKFIFDAGLAFVKPVYSILTSAISQYLPPSATYRAGDVNQTEIYRHYEKYGQLRDKNSNSSPWFSPIIIKKRLVDLTSNYYLVDKGTGNLTKFYTDFGRVELNLNPLDRSPDSYIINLALAKWSSYPYNHTYNWDKKLWPYDGKTNTYSPTIVTTISR